MWSTPAGEQYAFSGRHYELAPGPALPKPLQRPHPPVIVGGTGPRRTPALAARVAAEFNVAFMDVESTAARFAAARAACAENGRDPDEPGLLPRRDRLLRERRGGARAPGRSGSGGPSRTFARTGPPGRPRRSRRASRNIASPARAAPTCRSSTSTTWTTSP